MKESFRTIRQVRIERIKRANRRGEGIMSTTQKTSPVLEPTTQAFIDKLVAAGGPPIYTLDPKDARKVLEGAQKVDVKLPAVDSVDTTWNYGPTGQVKVRIVRPQGAKETLPAVLYYHGGGWVLGDVNTHDRLAREIATKVHAAVVVVDYDRSPEARFPIAIEQGYAALKYVADHAKELNVDAARLAVGGDSVGGNLAAVVTLLAKERGGPALKGQLLFYPVTDANFETGSYNEFAEGPWLTKAAMKWFWDAYLPDAGARKHRYASPLQATLEELKGLPRALVMTSANDVLRDEGEAYAQKLAQAGVSVAAVRYMGTIHDYALLNAITEAQPVRESIAQGAQFLKEVLVK
jgi:acetyl esterase